MEAKIENDILYGLNIYTKKELNGAITSYSEWEEIGQNVNAVKEWLGY
jgi:hypothetical protein